MRRRWLAGLVTLLATLCPAQSAPTAAVAVKVLPARPLIEHRGAVRFWNFDLLLQNTGTAPLHLNRIQVWQVRPTSGGHDRVFPSDLILKF